jgi:hypothetical protein
MRKQQTEPQLPETPGNAKHKSRQVKKKNGDNTKAQKKGQQ